MTNNWQSGFFNTTNLVGDDIKYERKNAGKQEIRILNYFRANPTSEFSPAQIWNNIYKEESVPITSVRRAMTELTHRGFLVKTDRKSVGAYGKLNYCWKLAVRHYTEPLPVNAKIWDSTGA